MNDIILNAFADELEKVAALPSALRGLASRGQFNWVNSALRFRPAAGESASPAVRKLIEASELGRRSGAQLAEARLGGGLGDALYRGSSMAEMGARAKVLANAQLGGLLRHPRIAPRRPGGMWASEPFKMKYLDRRGAGLSPREYSYLKGRDALKGPPLGEIPEVTPWRT